MHYHKYVTILAASVILLSACGGSHKTTSTLDISDLQKYDKVQVPDIVSANERSSYEQKLFMMPPRHPERLNLRGVLARSYVRSFNKTAEENYQNRFALFKDALALHDASDFAPGKVMDDLVPLAEWIYDRYEQLGDEAIVLASLRYLMLAHPGDLAAEERYTQLADWSESVRGTIDEQLEKYNSITALYLRMIQLVPDREVVEHAAHMFLTRQKAIMAVLDKIEASRGLFPPHLIRSLMRDGGMAKELIYAFFLAGAPEAAHKWLKKMDVGASNGNEYISLLEDLESDEDKGDGYFALAGLLGRDDPRAGMKACMIAREQDRHDPRFSLCIGKFFSEMGRPQSAVEFYGEAAAMAPEEETVMVAVLNYTRQALFELHQMEKIEEGARFIEQSDVLVNIALKSLDIEESSDLRAAAAALLHTSGDVEFDDGRIEASQGHFERALEVWSELFLSTLKLVEIHQMRDRHKVAIDIMDSALQKDEGGGDGFEMWRALILEQRAESYSELGQDDTARKDYLDALHIWEHADIPAVQGPSAQIRVGVILDRLGKIDESQESFRKAIRLDPDMRSTYAELLSFLVTQGRLKEAKEFYMIAFNQDRIEAMWKIYYSLWLNGLAARVNGEPYAFAQNYLEQRDGDSWQDDIARYYTGRISAEELSAKVTNEGQRVEVDFYVALKLLAEGKKKEADQRLKQVISSDLMGFFEYRMARVLLSEE